MLPIIIKEGIVILIAGVMFVAGSINISNVSKDQLDIFTKENNYKKSDFELIKKNSNGEGANIYRNKLTDVEFVIEKDGKLMGWIVDGGHWIRVDYGKGKKSDYDNGK